MRMDDLSEYVAIYTYIHIGEVDCTVTTSIHVGLYTYRRFMRVCDWKCLIYGEWCLWLLHTRTRIATAKKMYTLKKLCVGMLECYIQVEVSPVVYVTITGWWWKNASSSTSSSLEIFHLFFLIGKSATSKELLLKYVWEEIFRLFVQMENMGSTIWSRIVNKRVKWLLWGLDNIIVDMLLFFGQTKQIMFNWSKLIY